MDWYVFGGRSAMLRNYILIALRHFSKHRLFALINIFCLATGTTFSMVIGVYVWNQQQVNKDLADVDHQYILKSKWKVKGMGMDITTVPPLAKALKDEYPHLVRNYYRYNPVTNSVSAGDKHFKEDMAIGDTSLITMYGWPLLYGDPARAFANNNSAVITESLARRLFGTADALGKTFTIGTTVGVTTQDYSVSAVLKDVPYNSVTGLVGGNGYAAFLPTVGSRFYSGGDPSVSWQGAYEIGAVQLQPGVAAAQVEKAARQLLAKYAPPATRDNLTVQLAPVKEYYLRDNNGAVSKMIRILSLIAVFIILMAIINFIHISLGTSAYRLKEIGLRKVFGGLRRQLAAQFLMESYVLTGVAVGVSLGAYQWLRPLFGRVLNTRLEAIGQFGVVEWLGLAAGVLLVGLLAGGYPAFVLSRAGTVNATRGKESTARGGVRLRQGLLVVQFTLAIFVFISTLIVSRQVYYIFHKDLGYDKERVLIVTAFPKRWDSIGVAHMEDIKQGLLQLPAVKSACLSFEIPDRQPPQTMQAIPEGGHDPYVITQIDADEDYGKTYGMQLLAGSFFYRHGSAHIPWQLVINESAARLMGFTPEGAIGKKVKNPDNGPNAPDFTIAGVIKDYHFASLSQAIEPLAFVHVKDGWGYRYLALKLSTPDMAQGVADVSRKWKELLPTAPFEYSFMDNKFEALYRSALQLKDAAMLATVLNLVVVIVGLFGVVALTITRRSKEMAVRKVLGADAGRIIGLFLRDYAGVIVLANVIAWPLAYLFTSNWLENYAYRIRQDIAPYLGVCGIIFAIVAVLVGGQCYRTARENPTRKLRAE
jgi:ABC-type antimicrobial peptide transport system permease subunit